MASSSSLLSEEQFQCSICLEVFTDPVSIPCGHNFCMACIRGYWGVSGVCQCPLCKETFSIKPELRVNTFISEMAAEVKKLSEVKGTLVTKKNKKHKKKVTPTPPHDETIGKLGEVSCDVCTGPKFIALKSCLVCLASYCETHLEPHQRVASFKKHKLMDPVKNLEDRVCKKHERPLELFCRRDQTCVCQFCTETDHKTHDTVPMEEEHLARKVQLGRTKGELRQRIKGRLQKVKEIQRSVELSKADAEEDMSEAKQVFTLLARSIVRSQNELIEAIMEKQKAAERRAEGLMEELEQEITELQRRVTEIEHLSHTEDTVHLIQSSQSLFTLPRTKDWSEIGVHGNLCVGTVRRAFCQLEKILSREIGKRCDVELKKMRRYAVDMTFDPDTAHVDIIVSKDGRQVRLADRQQSIFYPSRFHKNVCVLGNEGFSSGRSYYEVQVKGKTGWVLGIARESINRHRQLLRSPEHGHWAVGLLDGVGYQAHAGPDVLLSLKEKPQKVGVFVDYEEGEVSFYDVEARSHIYSFTGCTFAERLLPCFSTSLNEDGQNAAPLIICPISHSD